MLPLVKVTKMLVVNISVKNFAMVMLVAAATFFDARPVKLAISPGRIISVTARPMTVATSVVST